MANILGLEVITDCQAFLDVLESPIFKAGGDRALGLVDRLFPGILAAVLQAKRELETRETKKAKATTLVFFNYRAQVWSLGSNTDPSRIYKILGEAKKIEVAEVGDREVRDLNCDPDCEDTEATTMPSVPKLSVH